MSSARSFHPQRGGIQVQRVALLALRVLGDWAIKEVEIVDYTDKLPPVHPGEILMEDFIEGFEITQHKLAVSIGVPPRRINEIVHGKRGIIADTALRLGKYFGVEPIFWMNLQNQYEIEVAEDKALAEIERIQPVQAASA